MSHCKETVCACTYMHSYGPNIYYRCTQHHCFTNSVTLRWSLSKTHTIFRAPKCCFCVNEWLKHIKTIFFFFLKLNRKFSENRTASELNQRAEEDCLMSHAFIYIFYSYFLFYKKEEILYEILQMKTGSATFRAGVSNSVPGGSLSCIVLRDYRNLYRKV